MSQRAFLLDLNRCTGCQACAIACGTENYPERLGAGSLNWRRIHTFNAIHLPGLPSFSLSLACNHCVEPACLAACPARAYTKDPATGAVLVDADRCIGCKYCLWACPYDAPRLDPATRTIEKCTFCDHRLAAGSEPACVVSCPTGALQTGEHRPGDSRLGVIGIPPTDLEPAIQLVAMRAPAVQVAPPCPDAAIGLEGSPAFPQPSFGGARAPGDSARISLATERSLFVFTTVVMTLVALFAALQLGVEFAPGWFAPFFIAAGAGAMLLSTWHLGRKARAWRAILNWRTSWLSREILLLSAFLLSATAWLLGWAELGSDGSALRSPRPALQASGPAIALLGFVALFAVDRVYAVIRPPARKGRAPARIVGPTLAASLYLAGLLAHVARLWAPAAVLKLLLYLPGRRAGTGWRDERLSTVRVAVGLLAPAALLAFGDGHAWGAPAFVLGWIGELIERAQFYDGLRVTTPQLEMEMALAARLRRT